MLKIYVIENLKSKPIYPDNNYYNTKIALFFLQLNLTELKGYKLEAVRSWPGN